MRKKKTDPLKNPIDVSTISSVKDDCLGKEWEATHKECLKCSYYDVCMILTLDNPDKEANIKSQFKNFADEIDWDLVPWSDIMFQIMENPKTITLQDLKDTVFILSKCLDKKTVHYRVQNWIIKNEVKIENGCLYL